MCRVMKRAHLRLRTAIEIVELVHENDLIPDCIERQKNRLGPARDYAQKVAAALRKVVSVDIIQPG
eukprot:scaffold239965_cov21-Prasinocladus_malaysianus.AAC.1